MRLASASTVIVAACLLSAMFCSLSMVRVRADSTTIYVDVRNLNAPDQDGSAAHPFDSIQKGVDAAGNGDTVQVAPGVYYGEVDIDKSFFSLVGQEGSTIIDGNGTGLVGIHIYHVIPDYTENVSISGFTVRNFVKGITLSRSIYIRLRDDSMVNNTYNFGDYTLQAQDIDTSNTVNGKPIYFWVNQHNEQVPSDAGFVDLTDSSNITVTDLNLTNNVQGLVLKNTTDSLIENVRITNNWDGLYLQRWSNSNTIIDSIVSNNLGLGGMGIYVSTSNNNTISNNSISNNYCGLVFDSTVYQDVIGYQPTGNTVMYNVVTGNTVANNSSVGVELIQSQENLFYDNNFVNNTQQVLSTNSTNAWDNGYEGNYWQDYVGQDLNETGIGDVPYVIDENNLDNHPLMGLFSDFPVTWQEETYPVIAISNSTISGFYFSQPNKAIGFSVNPSADEGSGFCMVNIPVSLLGGPYTVVLDGVRLTNPLETSNGTNCSLYLTYNDSSHDVKITGTTVVSAHPQFPSFLLLLFLAAALAAGVVIFGLRKRKSAHASA
jgi:parallel beta-helix repeat protein